MLWVAHFIRTESEETVMSVFLSPRRDTSSSCGWSKDL